MYESTINVEADAPYQRTLNVPTFRELFCGGREAEAVWIRRLSPLHVASRKEMVVLRVRGKLGV